MKTMYILETLKELGFVIDDSVDNSNHYLSNGGVLMEVVAPHSGNDFTVLVRAEFHETFNKWGSATWEWHIKDLEDFDTDVVFTILGLVDSYKTNNSIYRKYLKDNN